MPRVDDKAAAGGQAVQKQEDAITGVEPKGSPAFKSPAWYADVVARCVAHEAVDLAKKTTMPPAQVYERAWGLCSVAVRRWKNVMISSGYSRRDTNLLYLQFYVNTERIIIRNVRRIRRKSGTTEA